MVTQQRADIPADHQNDGKNHGHLPLDISDKFSIEQSKP